MSIEVKYTNDVNLNDIHSRVRTILKDRKTDLEAYAGSTSELLEVYNALKPTKAKTLVFGKKAEVEEESNDTRKMSKQRNIVISRYLKVVSRFVELKKTKMGGARGAMCDCGGLVKFAGDFAVCEECDCVQHMVETGSDGIFGEDHKKQDDTKVDGILQAMMNFQGKQRKVPPPEAMEKLRKHLSTYPDPRVITIGTVMTAMQALNLKDHYTIRNYVWAAITGNRCPDISSYETVIIDRYKLLYQKLGHVIRSGEKGSPPRDIHVLRALLEMEGFRCDPDFYPEIKTTSVKENFNITMRLACNEMQALYPSMNWKYVPI